MRGVEGRSGPADDMAHMGDNPLGPLFNRLHASANGICGALCCADVKHVRVHWASSGVEARAVMRPALVHQGVESQT